MAAQAMNSVPRLAPDSLGFALDCAAQVVQHVRAGTALPAALAHCFASLGATQAATARGAIQSIAYCAMRRLGLADWLLRRRVSKPPVPFVANVLSCAFALLADDDDTAAYAPFTVVDQAVRAVGARRDTAFAKGLVNAVLRGFLRERGALLAAAHDDEVARWNYPQWWIDAMRAAWPAAWQGILEAGNVPGPLTLRVNARRLTAADYVARLRAAQIDAMQIGEQAVRLAAPLPVERIPGFAEGDVSVQDASAQLAAPMLDVRDGMRVLDACAAPGGKTCHLLELADLELIALENDAARAARIRENLTRLDLSAHIVVGDATTPAAWYDGQPFDRVLVDAPCSASGIVRRHPDIRWLRRAADIDALVAQQRHILDALWPLVKPGGELLYATCSVFPDEGEQQARWFEHTRADAVRLGTGGQLLPAALAQHTPGHTANGRPGGNRQCSDGGDDANACHGYDHDHDHDGFFYARFRKLLRSEQ
jgi:16S rRNA (cytosine967-C5)-methyltransferase